MKKRERVEELNLLKENEEFRFDFVFFFSNFFHLGILCVFARKFGSKEETESSHTPIIQLAAKSLLPDS